MGFRPPDPGDFQHGEADGKAARRPQRRDPASVWDLNRGYMMFLWTLEHVWGCFQHVWHPWLVRSQTDFSGPAPTPRSYLPGPVTSEIFVPTPSDRFSSAQNCSKVLWPNFEPNPVPAGQKFSLGGGLTRLLRRAICKIK